MNIKELPYDADTINRLDEMINDIIEENNIENLDKKVKINFYLFEGFDPFIELKNVFTDVTTGEWHGSEFTLFNYDEYKNFESEKDLFEFLKSACVDIDKSDNMIHASSYLIYEGHIKPEGYIYLHYNKGDKNPYKDDEIFEFDCTVIGLNIESLNFVTFYEKWIKDRYSDFVSLLPKYEIDAEAFEEGGGDNYCTFLGISTYMSYIDLQKLYEQVNDLDIDTNYIYCYIEIN